MLNFIRRLFARPATAANEYRIVRYGGGWEPQMSYTAGMVNGVFWFPLDERGYWLEPDAFTNGKITKHISFPKDVAQRIIMRSRALNGQHIAAAE